MNAIRTPALIVWLGTTPKLAERELCKHMLSLSQEDCHRVALVHIDTDEEAIDQQEHESTSRKFSQGIAVPIGIDYVWPPTKTWHTYIPAKTPKSWANGAGGIRNHGHVAAAHDLQKVDRVLDLALESLGVLTNVQNERRISEVHTNIVAFLGGGTGSGILGDITVMIREKLNDRQYQQRINLFCMLPGSTEGADPNDIGWRKSNATACLLELIALSLVADTQPERVYKKYMLNECHNVYAGAAIANEIYLVGRTNMGNVDDIARIVGLDLFQRITDASGVGQLEHSEWMGRRALGSRDDRGLPAMFGTSCPFEVLFPAQEVARAYAQISASYLLPCLVDIGPPPPDIEDRRREDWINEWRDVAILEEGIQGKPLAVTPSREFSMNDFSDVGPDTLGSRWQDLQERQSETDDKIRYAVQQKHREEKLQIDTVPRPEPMERTSPLVRKITHLRLLTAEYKMVQDVLKRNRAKPVPPKPEWDHSWMHTIPYVGDKLKQAEAERLRGEYNYILELHDAQTRYNLLLQTVEELVELVQVRLNDALRWFSLGEDIEQKSKDLASTGYKSAAWHGILDRQHPHQRHVFDLNVFYDDTRERNLAAEHLYLWATFPDLSERSITQGMGDKKFVHGIAQAQSNKFIQPCTAYLIGSELGGSFDAQTMDTELELQSKERLVERVVDYFYEYYMQQFRTKNLFELLRIGSSPGKAPISDYLHQHLYHIKGLIGSLIGFQPDLWPEGKRQRNASVYLGMHWENGTQESELKQAVSKLGAVTSRNQTAQIKSMHDPHRLEILYGEHGISLSTVQEFYRDTNSSMAEYIRYQSEWYGNQQPTIFPASGQSAYGTNQMPVHSSGEMEELVCNPNAFGYTASQPHAQKYTTNLIGRVIRDTKGLGNSPNWSGTPASGTGPSTPPSNPWTGTTPNWGGTPASGTAPGTSGPAAGNPPTGGPSPSAGGNPPP